LRAIWDVYNGRLSLDRSVAQKVMQELRQPLKLPLTEEPLTQREVEIMKLVAEGLTNQDIADRLVVSERTVRAHVSNILAKLHLANRTQAALYALREGIASIEDNS
jgi:NarL family two-component system response regulator LiaR